MVNMEDLWRIYVPASPGEEGAFEASDARYEGFWRTSFGEESDLSWPEPVVAWTTKPKFLAALDRAEAIAESISYRGYSPCRLCNRGQGSQSLMLVEWQWPSGFRHYVAEHSVRPSITFEDFILNPQA
ncbi:MAG: hypothetical protein ABR923_21175, partial [Terracidiphilus sp.]